MIRTETIKASGQNDPFRNCRNHKIVSAVGPGPGVEKSRLHIIPPTKFFQMYVESREVRPKVDEIRAEGDFVFYQKLKEALKTCCKIRDAKLLGRGLTADM